VSRALTFAEADIVATARERTVPVAQDNFAVSMRQDDEGNFLRALLPQVGGPGPKSAGRQGIFLLTASGTVLGFAGACDDMKAVREVFAAALARWDALPAEARTAQVPAMGAAGARYASTPPADALTLDVTTRLLERDEKGVLRDSSLMALRPHSRFHPGPQLDRAWLQMVDWRALVPNPLTPGASKHLVRGFLDRLAASYLFDSTTGFRQIWADNEIRDARLTSTVERVEGDEAHLATTPARDPTVRRCTAAGSTIRAPSASPRFACSPWATGGDCRSSSASAITASRSPWPCCSR